METSDEDDFKEKNKIYYNVMLNAWLNTRLERDKQLLGLSVFGIGLIVTLLRTVGASSSWQSLLFIVSLVAFLITVISIIYIFDQNAVYIDKVLKGDKQKSKALKRLDQIAAISFLVAIISIVFIGILYLI